jgi:hypothetical protein
VPAAPPASGVVLASAARRAPGVLIAPRRGALADRVAALLHADERRPGSGVPAAGARGGVSRVAVREARGRLLDVEHALRSGIPLPRHGEHLAERLVDDAAAGVYAPGGPSRTLRADAAAASAALGSVTPFA